MVRMRIADVEEDIDHELVSKEQIDAKIHEMAALASEDYRDKNPLLVAVLKGAVNTLVAFTQAMSIPVQIDFMSLSSYGSGTVSSGEVTVRQDLSADVRGRHILIVEDIVDSGHTLAWLVAELKRRGAASVEVFALLSKPSRREVDVDVKYAGYEIPDEFVVGFGLDFDERYRNLDSIAVLKPSVYKECKHELPARGRVTAIIRTRTTTVTTATRSPTRSTVAITGPMAKATTTRTARYGSPLGYGVPCSWSWSC